MNDYATAHRSLRLLRWLLRLACFAPVLFALANFASVAAAPKVSTTVVISQIYGGGGNTGATYTNDFIELFNLGNASQSLNGWSVQYASAGSVSGSFLVTNLTNLTLAPGQYYLIQEASGGAVGAALPTPDATGTINLSATTGKVALVNSTVALAVSGTGCPSFATVVDFIGYGVSANCSETANAPAPSNTTAVLRAANGCTDTDSNSGDFAAGTPNPRNTSSPLNSCSAPTNPSGAGAAKPSIVATGASTLLTVNVTPGTNPTSTGLVVACDLSAIGGSATQAFFDDGTNGDAVAGNNVFSFQTTATAAPGVKNLLCTIGDAQVRSGSASISLTVTAAPIHIHDVQGAAHSSPYSGTVVSLTPSIVTARRSNGFYMQDPAPDADDRTSEGIFVFTSSAPTVNVGDNVSVGGTVAEFRAGGGGSTNLTTTEITSPSIVVNSTGNPLPPAVLVGTGGRIPPSKVIEDDAAGDVETSGVFDPAFDGIDFYESLEGMLVELNDVVAVGPTVSFGGSTPNREIPVLGDLGANAGVRTPRGGIIVRSNDFNPERIILNDELTGSPVLPPVVVGDTFPGLTLGIIDYSFGNFKLQVSSLPGVVPGGLVSETTSLPSRTQMALGNYNVENLSVTDTVRINELASIISNNLRSPDLLSLQEIQDDSGYTDNGTVGALATIHAITTAIVAAGGPVYDYREIDPVNDQDGGAPGANIRQIFLFSKARGLAFVDRPGGTSTLGTTVVNVGGTPQLSFSPGRIDPTNAAWNSSRKPLAGEFNFNGHHFFVIANHFNSKSGDQPLFGHFQPPTLSSETQRVQQAQIVHDFVNQILAIDPNADVFVQGDLNDFEFSNPMLTLKGSILFDLGELLLPQPERYTYDFEGNAQALDHILITGHLYDTSGIQYDIVHVNSEFLDSVRESDHDPEVARMFTAPTDVSLERIEARSAASESSLPLGPLLLLGAVAFGAVVFARLRRRSR